MCMSDPANPSSYTAGKAYICVSTCADLHVHNAVNDQFKDTRRGDDPGSLTQPSWPPPPQIGSTLDLSRIGELGAPDITLSLPGLAQTDTSTNSPPPCISRIASGVETVDSPRTAIYFSFSNVHLPIRNSNDTKLPLEVKIFRTP